MLCHLHYQVVGIALYGTYHFDKRYAGHYRGVHGKAPVCIWLREIFQELHSLLSYLGIEVDGISAPDIV